jgi:hypothetical protein
MTSNSHMVAPPPPRRMAYPPSTLLRGLEWLAPASKYPGSGSDMHWYAWGDDDALYVVDDDGANFGQPWNFGHLLRATGVPPRHEVTEVSRFAGLRRYETSKLRYVCGALAVGSRLYVCAYDYNFDDPGSPTHTIDEEQRDVPTAPPLDWRFINMISAHAGVAAIMYSDDYGVTWQNIPERDTPYFFGPRFGAPAFVGFGPGYSGVPERLGDYVYAISNDENWENGNNVFLARVPRERVLERGAWEFYTGGRDAGNPQWSSDEAAARPILSDPGHVGHPTMTYNAGLDRFLLAFGSDVVPHAYGMPREFARDNWHTQRELHIYEGPSPWGPWYLVHYEPHWEGIHLAYLPQIPAKWLSDDGLSGTLLFSGDYRFTPLPEGESSFYGFMTRPFRLLPA